MSKATRNALLRASTFSGESVPIHLILKNVECLSIEIIRVPIDDLKVFGVLFLSSHLSDIRLQRRFDER
jgi:hypothetical protein